MKTIINVFTSAALLLLALGIFAGCESTGDGGNYYSTTYYGTGWYGNPYYDRDDDNDNNIIVRPPPDSRPDQQPRPTHPIANPPQTSRPSARPMPRMPSAPRGSSRSGGGRR